MSDHKPIAIAMTVGTLAIAANGAAAIVALSATTRPEVMGFGIAGLAAACVGLTLTLVWACSSDPREQRKPRRKIFAPWRPEAFEVEAEPDPTEIPVLSEIDEQSAIAAVRLAMAAQPVQRLRPQPRPTPAPAPNSEPVVVNLHDWLQERHSNASA